MAAQLKWDPGDSAGERTLPCVFSPGRWNRWKMMPKVKGEVAEAVGDGTGYVWAHRQDKMASMELTIAYTDADLAHEFLEWVNEFGKFDVHTGDAASTIYEDCQIKVGTDADISPPDPETLDLTLSLTVIHLATVPVPLINPQF